MHTNSPTASPNEQAYQMHRDNGLNALDMGLYQQATVHFRHAARALKEIITRSSSPSFAEKRTQDLEKLAHLVDSIKDRPDERPDLVPIEAIPDAGFERRITETGKASTPGKYRGVEQYRREESVQFADIIGHEFAKDEVIGLLVLPIKEKEWCREYGYKGGGGILFVGPPGTGKSQLAKAAANQIGGDFYQIEPAALLSQWQGVSEKNVSDLFKGICAYAKDTGRPAVIFFEECDGLLETADRNDSGAQRKIVTQVQAAMDDISRHNQMDGNPPIVVIGATNFPWVLSDSMRRRFTTGGAIYVGLPTIEDRKRLFEVKSAEFSKHFGDVDFGELAERTEGLSGDDISKICGEVSREAVKLSAESNQATKVTQAMFLEQVDRHAPSSTPESLSRLESWCDKYAKRGIVNSSK